MRRGALLDEALAASPVGKVVSTRTDANYGIVIGVAEGNFDHLEAALELAEAEHCRTVALAAFGVYERTAEAAHVYANANGNTDELARAQRLFADAIAAAPATVHALRGEAHHHGDQTPLISFAAQLGYVEFIDVIVTITGYNEINPHFNPLN